MKNIIFIFGSLFSAELENIPFILSSLESNISILSGAREEANVYSVDDIIIYAAIKNQLDPALIKAVIQVESGGKHEVVSPAGAIGIMQIMPGTASDLGIYAFDIFDNINGGSAYLKQQIDRFGNIHDALIAYNSGPGNFERGTIPDQSHQYAHKVIKLYHRNLTKKELKSRN